mmetsp:Transcript_57124/g.105636  ORF Transcript_57124/g.105636 Transcript_57124/m.105636 type:complete len:417 (+) Transcript_57124:73-1323(+)
MGVAVGRLCDCVHVDPDSTSRADHTPIGKYPEDDGKVTSREDSVASAATKAVTNHESPSEGVLAPSAGELQPPSKMEEQKDEGGELLAKDNEPPEVPRPSGGGGHDSGSDLGLAQQGAQDKEKAGPVTGPTASTSWRSPSLGNLSKRGSKVLNKPKNVWRALTGSTSLQQSDLRPTAQSDASPSAPSAPKAAYRKSGNTNMPQDYKWLSSVLEDVTGNRADSLGCSNLATGKLFIPLFFVMGGCPNMWAGMQVIMYAMSGDGEVDFWWVKPTKQGDLERNTLNRHARGQHKNDPNRSRPFYQPIADIFQQGSVVNGRRFGIETVEKARRAYFEQDCDGKVERMYVSLVWQEDWTSNPFARSKFIKGKIVYQKDLNATCFHSRQYAITNNVFSISEIEDESFTDVIPPEAIKLLLVE